MHHTWNEPDGGYRDRTPSALFDGQSWTRLRYSTLPTAGNPKVIVVRLPASANDVLQYNFRNGYSTQTEPTDWTLETSPDGVNWTLPNAWVGQVPATTTQGFYNGGVHYQILAGRSGSPGLSPTANVRVDQGATLDFGGVAARQTLANLTVDPALLATVSTFGKYALAYTAIEGALNFAEDNVVTIENSAFEKSIKITSLNIPALNSTIGEKAFWHCTGLKTVELGGVVSIGWAALSRDDNDKGATPGTYSLEKVVLSPALTVLNGSTFYKSTKSGCVFDVVSPKDMPEAKSGDGKISGNDFQDLGTGSIVIPFKGTCTIGQKVFHWSSTTNFIFWGKAPTAWIGNSTAVYDSMKDFNTSVKTDRMLTVSLVMDQEGWEGVATMLKKNYDSGEWAALNPPENAFGYVMANTTRIWLCEGKSPWEPKPGLLIYIR